MKRYYHFLAVVTFNAILLFALINALAAGILFIRDTNRQPAVIHPRISQYRAFFADLQAYTRISPEVANRYLDEQDAMGSRGFQYAPWVEFRHPQVQGSFLNTDVQGFRRSLAPRRLGPNPVKIHVFGGSTTFGYGVPDDHTIPSYLQSLADQKAGKPVLVRNFAQGYYYSSQELLVLISRIKDGDIPDWAVFIDGNNDVGEMAYEQDEPHLTPIVTELWDARRGAIPGSVLRDLSWVPVVRLASRLAVRWGLRPRPSRDVPKGNAQRIGDYIIHRYMNNIRMIRAISKDYGIRCLFVWQPCPFYKYDRTLHRNFPYATIPEYWTVVYDRLKSYESPDFLYLGDMLEGSKAKVFVDDSHYNELTNEAIAARILARLNLN